MSRPPDAEASETAEVIGMLEPGALDPLDADAEAVLRAVRQRERLTEATSQRVWQAIERDVASPRRARWAMAAVTVAAAASVVWFVRGSVLSMQPATEHRQAAYSVDNREHETSLSRRTPRSKGTPNLTASTPDEAPDTQRVEPPQTPDAEQTQAAAETEAPVTRRVRRRVPKQASPALEDTLAREVELLRATQAALESEDPHEALQLLDRWQREIPRGELQAEREGLRAIALCESGDVREGSRVRKSFEQRWPLAPLRKRVTDSCERAD